MEPIPIVERALFLSVTSYTTKRQKSRGLTGIMVKRDKYRD